MSRHRREWKARRKYTHPRPDNKVLAARKRDRKKAIEELGKPSIPVGFRR